MATKKPVKYPKALGECIDLLYERRQQRLAKQREVDLMKEGEADLEGHIINNFSKTELKGAKGMVATAAVKKDTVVQLVDWEAFVKWVAKEKAWDMLIKQSASTAVKERWNAHKEVPGVKPFVKVSLSLTKSGG